MARDLALGAGVCGVIYLDYQATTPLAPEALDAMLPWLRDGYANPHSAHAAGRKAKAAVEVARAQILSAFLQPAFPPSDTTDLHPRTAEFLRGIDEEMATRRKAANINSGSVFFTSGATEAANWAIRGTYDRLRHERPKIVTIATEHACVLDTIDSLRKVGAEIVILPVGHDGHVDLRAAEAEIDNRTAIVTAMLVNNEIGTIQYVERLGHLAKAAGAVTFCDAVQGFCRTQLPTWACDLIAISAHKIYGPKGIGALWVRKGCEPAGILHGGGQEGGIRSGTLSPALCAGFGAAVRTFGGSDTIKIKQLWSLARSRLKGPDWSLNGDRVHRYHGNLNIRRDGLDVARLMSDLRDIAFSAGSACASGSGRASHVLRAIGLSEAQARSSIRLGFGRYTTEDELTEAIDRIIAAADRQQSTGGKAA